MRQAGCGLGRFEKTVTAFNENAKAGVDPDWHRGEYDFDKGTAGDLSGKRTELVNNCLAPLEKGPFYGAKYVPGTCGTSGGLRINGSAQVLNVWGRTDQGSVRGRQHQRLRDGRRLPGWRIHPGRRFRHGHAGRQARGGDPDCVIIY